MFKVLVAVLLILSKVTVLAKVNLSDKTQLLEIYINCVHDLNLDENIGLNIFNINDSTLPEDSQQITDLAECEIKKMHVVNRNGTLVAKQFKKLIYTHLDHDPNNPSTSKRTKVIKRGFRHCGIRKGIPFNGKIAIKLFNCVMKYLKRKKDLNIIKLNVNEELQKSWIQNYL